MIEEAELIFVLEFLFKAEIPTILVLTKCDLPTNSWPIDYEELERYRSIGNIVGLFQSSLDFPQEYKNYVSVILRSINTMKAGKLSMSCLGKYGIYDELWKKWLVFLLCRSSLGKLFLS